MTFAYRIDYGGGVIMVYEVASDSILCVLIFSDKTPSQERQESNTDELMEEWEIQLQSPPSLELYSCFIPAGNTEIKGAVYS